MSDTDQSCNAQMQAERGSTAAGSPPQLLPWRPARRGIRDQSNGASACRSFSLQPPRDLPQILHAFRFVPRGKRETDICYPAANYIPQPQQPTCPPAGASASSSRDSISSLIDRHQRSSYQCRRRRRRRRRRCPRS
jgi:hypothetical protein